MKFKDCKSLILSDLDRLSKTKHRVFKYFFFNASFRITFWFRIGTYLQTKSGLLYKLLYGVVFLIHKHNQYLTGIQLPLGTKVDKGLSFSHFSCIIINHGSRIGENSTIQGVTIGSVRGPKGGVPTIGNNVVLSSGSKVIGNVRIGDNVMIGAGAVVVNDIPDDAVAVGIPAKVISYDGKEHTQYYLKN